MNKFSFIADGKTKDFFFTFPFFTKQDVVIHVNHKTASRYTLYCIDAGMNADVPFTGGRVHFNKPPKATDVITICRRLELKRHVDYQPTQALTPMLMNQDMNFMLEILKDMKNELLGFADKYAEITNKDENNLLLSRIDAVNHEIDNVTNEINITREQIIALGDIQSIHDSINALNTAVLSLNTALDTTNSNISVLENFKADVSDYVIESQAPNSGNNYTWYRKYKSGWVEQGGTTTIERQNANTDLRTNVNLPVEMADDKYYVAPLTFIEDGGTTTGLRNHQNQRYTTYLRIGTFTTTGINKAYTVQWSVCGYAKE